MLYIVHVKIDQTAEASWAKWMKEIHIPEVMDTQCFEWAIMNRVASEDTDTHRGYRFTYKALDDATFERYEATFAATLRDDHTTRYAGKFEAYRELLPTEGQWYRS